MTKLKRADKILLYHQGVESVLVVGARANSTTDLYILPRLSKSARDKVIYLNPHRESERLESFVPKGCLVIISRYVNRSVVSWLKKYRNELAGVVWVVDDDYRAMVANKSVPLLNKIKPVLTLQLQFSLKNIVDYVLVSSKQLYSIYSDWPVVLCAPLTRVPETVSDLNPKQFYYFAKMHAPEQEYLFKVISKVLTVQPEIQITVIANKRWVNKWRSLERVTAYPEMEYRKYCSFLDALEVGGVFLVPLTESHLNASRSDAKLVDVVRTGSAAFLADQPAYAEALALLSANQLTGYTSHMSEDVWIAEIVRLSQNPEVVEKNRRVIAGLMRERWMSRFMIA